MKALTAMLEQNPLLAGLVVLLPLLAAAIPIFYKGLQQHARGNRYRVLIADEIIRFHMPTLVYALLADSVPQPLYMSTYETHRNEIELTLRRGEILQIREYYAKGKDLNSRVTTSAYKPPLKDTARLASWALGTLLVLHRTSRDWSGWIRAIEKHEPKIRDHLNEAQWRVQLPSLQRKQAYLLALAGLVLIALPTFLSIEIEGFLNWLASPWLWIITGALQLFFILLIPKCIRFFIANHPRFFSIAIFIVLLATIGEFGGMVFLLTGGLKMWTLVIIALLTSAVAFLLFRQASIEAETLSGLI